ncbi:MAG: cytochrome c3 family protein [Planctomycetota bacterium]|nr:cytochrome c3 family protein [Planctomycetota bacterium]
MSGQELPIRKARSTWLCYALSLAVLAGLLALMGTGLAGCGDPQSRYKVLSFFFDGVPEPGAPPRPRGVRRGLGAAGPEDLVATSRPTSGPAGAAAAAEAPLVYHAPFKDPRKCKFCHDPSKSFGAPAADTCRQCHKPHYDQQWDDWTHGPVALGQCSLCHTAHSSRYAGLLTAPMPDLCLGCHEAKRTLERPYHATATVQACTNWHDPPFAGNRQLLPDSAAYARRAGRGVVLPSKHNEWKKPDACVRCHTAESSNQPVADVDKVCLSCHPKIQQPIPGQKMHEAVAKGKCTACHTAHKSSRPSLIKPAAEKNCLGAGCHDLAKIQTDKHPKISRGDCVFCHNGHSSPREHLLRVAPLMIEKFAPMGASRPATVPASAPATAPAASSAPATRRAPM